MAAVNTPYDDVFKTLLNDCSKLIIPVINEVFGECYTGKEEIVFSPNEHFLNQQGGAEQERITDTSFRIIGIETKKYHLECQSTSDSSMLIRFFEYDAQIALDDGEVEGSTLTVTFPHSAVLFLRSNKNTPDKMKVTIQTPGGCAQYEIPVMKSVEYTIDEIFEKKLLFLIPFHIFSHERKFETYNNDESGLEKLKAEYEGIKNRLEEELDKGRIDEYTKCTVTDMSGKVLEHIAAKYERIKEGVKTVMGGKVLEYEAKNIRKAGLEEGLREGKKEGRAELLFELVQNDLLSIKDAASQLNLSEETFLKAMQNDDPVFTLDQI